MVTKRQASLQNVKVPTWVLVHYEPVSNDGSVFLIIGSCIIISIIDDLWLLEVWHLAINIGIARFVSPTS
jgi:hypothetical protein